MSYQYKYGCVLDSDNNYVTFVRIDLMPDENEATVERIYDYTLKDGEHVEDISPPPPDIVKPHWNGETWD